MTEYRKVYAYHEKNDGMYELKSYWTSSESTQFESGENLEEYRTTTENNINLKADRIEYDLDAGMLYLYSDETKIDEIPFRVSIKPKVNLGDIDDLQITQDNSAIKLSWDDPIDIEFSGLKIIEWAGTKVVRKEGSCPDSIEDGTLVIDSKTRNTYSSTPYSDNGLTNGVEYYYRFFPYDTEGNIIGDTCGEIIRVITLVPIEIPTVTGTYTYTGDTITPTFTNYDSDKMTRSGANSAKNAGTYTVTFTPKEGYMWVDTTVEAKEVNWTINPATISVVPSQSGTLTYNEQSQSPTWSNYNSDQLTISGNTSGTNAGSYTAVFTPKANYVWEDGSVSKSVVWRIDKASIQLTASETLVSIYEGNNHSIILSGCEYGYAISGYSGDDSTASVGSITNSILTITGDHIGNNNIDITEYNVPSEVYNNYRFIGVTIQVVVTKSPDISWEKVSDLSQNVYSAVVWNDYIYIYNDDGFYRYENGSWNKVCDRPYYGFNKCRIVVYDNKLYMLGSGNFNSSAANYANAFYQYDGNSWKKMPNLLYPFVNGYVCVYNNEIHIFGGENNGSSIYAKNHHKWDGNAWSVVETMSSLGYMYNGDAVVYNNKVHLLRSMVNTSSGPKLHCVWDGNTWRTLNNLPYSMIGGKAIVYNNTIHLLNLDRDSGHYHYQWNDVNYEQLRYSIPPKNVLAAVIYNNEIHIFVNNDGVISHYKSINV